MNLKMTYDKHGRYYYDPEMPERHFYSVSTVLKWGEPKGRANDAAKIGTLIHYNILNQYTKKLLDIPTETPYWTSNDEVDRRIDDAIEMWINLGLDDVVRSWDHVEQPVWWEGKLGKYDARYAGQLDVIAKFNDGKIRLLDIKTGNDYDYYLWQMGGYVQASEFCLDLPQQISEAWLIFLDIGSGYDRCENRRFSRNPDLIPRVKVFDREWIDIGIKEFNHKLWRVFDNV